MTPPSQLGPEGDFEAWYRTEYARLTNSVALVIGDRGLAAEAVAEAFTRALARWNRVGRLDHRSGWVYRTAVNYATRAHRRGSQEQRLLRQEAATAVATVAPVEGDHELWQAVGRLPDRMRTIVVLRYVADLTEPAIAATLGVRRGTVATTLRRAHDRLATELGPSHISGSVSSTGHTPPSKPGIRTDHQEFPYVSRV